MQEEPKNNGVDVRKKNGQKAFSIAKQALENLTQTDADLKRSLEEELQGRHA